MFYDPMSLMMQGIEIFFDKNFALIEILTQ